MKALWLILAFSHIGSAWASDGVDPPLQPRWTPIFDGQMLLGQVFQDGKVSSWQGNANAQFTPAIKFSESVSLLPTYAASYQGTKSATELAGGSQLFQDSQSHLLNFKGIYRNGNWKLKPVLSYRWEFLRETSKERWGHGLFDYRKAAAGLGVEYSFLPRGKINAAFDYYAIDFSNYESLESKVSGSLGREQTQRYTLNTRNFSWTLGGSFPLPFEGGSAKLTGNITERRYPEQRLVAVTGTLISDLRSDEIGSVAGTFYYGKALSPKVSGLFSCALAYTRDHSNQNHYDAQLNVFNPDYYSYGESSIEPKITFILGARKVEASFSYLRIERNYHARLAQDAAGSYTSETTSLTQDSFLFNLSIPVAKGFKFIAHSALTNSGSNMRYEKIFRYNYTISSHLLGFSYSY